MKADAVATRMSVLTRALPSRILLVDDNEFELERMASRLATAGFDVHQACNGAEALRLLEQCWYPLIITDWQMPVMDGLALCEAVRARGVDSYIIMLMTRDATADYQRGYAAGVDDYLAKHVSDAEIFSRINTAFNTLALRRSLQDARAALDRADTIDAESGAYTATELNRRLQSELCRAERYDRPLSMVTVGVELSGTDRQRRIELAREIARTLENVVRAHIDWVARLPPRAETGVSFAVVLPEASISDGPAIKGRLMNAAARINGEHAVALTFGLAARERGRESGLEASAMIDVAEHCRACNGRVGGAQLEAVRHSVACGVGIACRQGYAVASDCPLRVREGQ